MLEICTLIIIISAELRKSVKVQCMNCSREDIPLSFQFYGISSKDAAFISWFYYRYQTSLARNVRIKLFPDLMETVDRQDLFI